MQRQPRLPIPEEFSPQLSSAQKISLESSRSRQVSHASKASVVSNTSEFIEHKIEEMSSEVECLETLKQGLAQAQDDGDKKEKTRITEKLERLRERSATTEEELVTLKRQKKIVAEDLDESKLDHDDLADAYASLIIDKLDSSTAKPKKKKFNQQQFRAAVGARYASSRATKIGSTELYCHVIQGWFSNKEVKAAHLVPKSLRSEELAYLFGVGDVVLTDPRNGMKQQVPHVGSFQR